MSNMISDHEKNGHEDPFRSPGHQNFNVEPMDLARLSAMQAKASVMGWNGIQITPMVKRIVRLDIPINKYPREDILKDQPGYENLNEQIHLLIEAEFPEDIIDVRMDHVVLLLEDLLKPEDEIRKQQLRELAFLDGK